MLPKLNYPKYSTKIPSTGLVVKYRPFTVNEEKILLTASESGDEQEMIEATKQVIANCFENINVDSLTTYDADFLFIQLRIKSVSPTSELMYRNMNCVKNGGEPCKKTINIKINLEDVSVKKFDEESEKFVEYQPKNQVAGGFKIDLVDGVGVIIKHPGFNEKLEFSKIENPSDDDLVKLCIVSVFDAESVYTKEEFSKENLDEFYSSLITPLRDKLLEFISDIPELRYETEFVCKECGFTEQFVFNKLPDFF